MDRDHRIETHFGRLELVSQWKLPYEKIPIDTEGVKFFASRIPRLEIEDEAHKNEHGIEVLLPFLLWANPQLKVVPIVIGDAELSDLELLASTLTEWRTDVEITKYDTSAKVSGDSSRVVGYAGALLK